MLLLCFCVCLCVCLSLSLSLSVSLSPVQSFDHSVCVCVRTCAGRHLHNAAVPKAAMWKKGPPAEAERDQSISCVRFSTGKQSLLAATSWDHTVHLWKIADNLSVQATDARSKMRYEAAAPLLSCTWIGGSGDTLVVGGCDCTARIVDAVSGAATVVASVSVVYRLCSLSPVNVVSAVPSRCSVLHAAGGARHRRAAVRVTARRCDGVHGQQRNAA